MLIYGRWKVNKAMIKHQESKGKQSEVVGRTPDLHLRATARDERKKDPRCMGRRQNKAGPEQTQVEESLTLTDYREGSL